NRFYRRLWEPSQPASNPKRMLAVGDGASIVEFGFCHRARPSSELAETGVTPPQKPAVSSNLSSLNSLGIAEDNIPISRHPSIFTAKVPKGKPPIFQSDCVLLEIRKRSTLPAPPPKNMIRRYFILSCQRVYNV